MKKTISRALLAAGIAVTALGLASGTAQAFQQQPDPPVKIIPASQPQPDLQGKHIPAFEPQPDPPGKHSPTF